MENSLNRPFLMAGRFPVRHSIPVLLYMILQLVPASFVYLFDTKAERALALGWWLGIGYAVTVVVSYFCLRPDWQKWRKEGLQANLKETVKWILIGLALYYAFLILNGMIEAWLAGGIENITRSENTDKLMESIQFIPALPIMIVLLGPIVEEFLFRHILFGNLSARMSFFFSALVSGLVFSLMHGDNKILIYVGLSFIFSFVFAKTRRISAPIVLHVFNNGVAVFAFYAAT